MLFHNDGNILKDCKRHFLLDTSVDEVQLVADLQALLIGQDALQQCDLPRAQEPESAVTGSCLLIPVLQSERISQGLMKTSGPRGLMLVCKV